MTARLFVLCGLPGSGKTTLAKQLEAAHDAARFCPDEWLPDIWDRELRAHLEARMWDLAQRLLQLGTNVVIEFGSWSRAERDELRLGAHALGARVELRYLDAPLDELERRIDARGNDAGITRAHLEEWAQLIEVPTAAEFACFDGSLA